MNLKIESIIFPFIINEDASKDICLLSLSFEGFDKLVKVSREEANDLVRFFKSKKAEFDVDLKGKHIYYTPFTSKG